MSDKENDTRTVWSCSLFRMPEEDESERLEERLQEAKDSIWEDAVMLQRYIGLTGLSQSACAKRLRRSQAGVANRLRLLKLSPELREKMRQSRLTERHARALLRLPDEKSRSAALEVIVRSGLNVAQTETYIDTLVNAEAERGTVPGEFIPLLDELEKLRISLPDVCFEVREEEAHICLNVRIPKKYDI